MTDKQKYSLSQILVYPCMCAQIEALERNIIHAQRYQHEGAPRGTEKQRPTELKAGAIENDRIIQRCRHLIANVGRCLHALPPEYQAVICLRFWGTQTEAEAIRRAGKGEVLTGLRLGSTKRRESVGELAGYSERQAGRIVRRFFAELEKTTDEN